MKKVTTNNVIKFFTEEIDGMGQRDGHPRNPDTPKVLALCNDWELRELTEEEFFNMIIPDGTDTLIKNKELSTTTGDSKDTIERWLSKLKKGKEVPPLIVRTRMQSEKTDFSFYIEDGAHKAIAYKIHFETNPYAPVVAYVGIREH